MGKTMSLINKVLKDLESRERAGSERPSSSMLEDLRAAPSPEKGVSGRVYWRGAGAVVVAVLLLAAGVEYGRHARPLLMPEAGSVVAQKGVVPSSAPTPVAVAAVAPSIAMPVRPSPPRVVDHSGSAARANRTLRPLRASLAPPQHSVSLRVRSARQTSAPLHFSGDGISRRALPETRPELSLERYRLAIASLQQGDVGAAHRDLKAALGFVPGGASPSLLLAGLDVRLGRLAAAQRVLNQGLRFHPHVRSLIMLLAQVDLRMGQPGAALAVLANVSPAAQTEPYWALLAVSQLRDGKIKAAARAYEEGVRRFPESGSLWVGLGLAESDRGDRSAARKAFFRAQKCALDPVLAHFVQQQLTGLSSVGR